MKKYLKKRDCLIFINDIKKNTMHQGYKQISSAGANSSSTMEPETIQKNGVSLKNQMSRGNFLLLSIVLLMGGSSSALGQNSTATVQQKTTPVVIGKAAYIDRYRTVSADTPQPKRVARKLPKPIQLLGYLWVYPEDLGDFKQHPMSVIANLNAQNPHGRNNWRMPTPEELDVLEANASAVGLGDDIYLATDHSNGVLRLVATKFHEGFVLAVSELGAPPYDGMSGTITNTGGSSYNVRSMGGVWWMTQNADKPVSGCTYNTIDREFGGLYSWNCASSACPQGWILPNDKDFTALSSWLTSNGKWREWNFDSSLAGYGDLGSYSSNQGSYGYWWSSSSSSRYWYVSKGHLSGDFGTIGSSRSLSVRCKKSQ